MTKRSDWQKRLFIGSFLLPGLALYTLFVAYPTAEGLRISLMDESLNISLRLVFEGRPAGGSWTDLVGTALVNYKRLLFEITEPVDLYRVRRYLTNSLFLFFFSLLDLLLGFAIAGILSHRPRGARLLRAVYFFPGILSVATAAIMWAMVLHPRHGLLNLMLRAAGAGKSGPTPGSVRSRCCPLPRWLSTRWPFIGVWGSMGVVILLFTAAIENVPESLHEAARIDGANGMQGFLYVTMPLVWEMFRTLLILRVIGLFGSVTGFSTVHILLRAGGGNAWLITNYYHYHAFNAHNWNYAAAIIVAVTVAAIILAAATLWLTRREPVTY